MAKKEKKITLEQQIKQLSKELVEELKHWQYLREYGCQDPFWADGVNMNLTRNHIIYYKMRLRELCEAGSLPEEYYLPTPPKVVPGHCEICGRDYDVMDFCVSTDFKAHSVCKTCAKMPERDIKELPQYQRNVIRDAKIMLITEKIIKDQTDDD